MSNELWEKIQMFINANQIELVSHHLVEEMKQNLSTKQISQLGDLNSTFVKVFSGDDRPISAKAFIVHFTNLVREGAIVGVDKD